MTSSQTIILCGGPINFSNLPLSTNLSNAMIPINGKPVIGWILDDLLAKGIDQATVVLRQQDRRLASFLVRAYGGRMDLQLATLKNEGTIVQSLQAGLQAISSHAPVRVVLGDTLIRDPFDHDTDFVYVGQVQDSRRWCLAILNGMGIIMDYVDKQDLAMGPHQALAGYYYFTDGTHLLSCVEHSIATGAQELSNVLRRYGALHPLYAQLAQEWHDFGNIDNLVTARQRLLQSRFFNSLSINPVLNTITKVSEHDEKLQDELDWYLGLPAPLQVLVPRIVSHERVNGSLRIVQEYYGYPTLAELYVYGDLHVDTWVSMLNRVLQIHREFCQYPGIIDSAEIRSMYVDKIWQRLNALRTLEPGWNKLLDLPEVEYNGKLLRGICLLSKAVENKTQQIVETAPVALIHGDLCFSNVLFDVNNQIVRLIDPRGRFGRKGIYGDVRYDIAKLRHSVHGLYDFVMADMFELDETEGRFTGRVLCDEAPGSIATLFDRMITGFGYDLDDIRFIEGLLFISMLPLHQGHPRRQQWMYLTGLSLLNEVL